ncbi:MAG: cohesin domain-containing protein [Acidobacteriota bacterium]
MTLLAALAAPGAVAADGARRAPLRPQQVTRQVAERPQDPGSQRPGAQDPEQRAAGIDRVGNLDEATLAGSATLLLTPSHLQLQRGERVRLTLSVLGADDLRRLPATLRFDPAVLELTAVRLGNAWDDGPQPLLLHDASRPGEVTIGLGLLDKKAPGVNGSAELLELEFVALGAGDAALRIERFAAIGAGSKPQPTTAVTAEIVVQ